MNKRTAVFVLTVGLLLGVFCFSGFQLLRYYTQSAKSQDTYDHLAAMMTQPVITATEPRPTEPGVEVTSPTEAPIPSGLVATAHPQTGETVYLLPEFQALYSLNPDLVGWISIADTHIHYPVVQSAPNRADYYLKRNFYGEKDSHGCIYAREQCDMFAPSDNITLFGHRMGDGTMFADLGKYKHRSFWEKQPYIRFDTLRSYGTYQVIAVFQIQAGQEDTFLYHLFVDAQSPAEFDAYWAQCQNLALYDTGLDAQYGDKLLTLSTCDYHRDNGRLVVVAKYIEP